LTCLTCHDPHAKEKPNYRQKCLDCHTDQSCKVAPATRRQKDAADNCVTCHMPRSDTDIPHIAFTHHRIARPAPRTPSNLQRIPELVPTDDVSQLPPREQERNLGLAYLEAAQNREYQRYTGEFAERAINLLGGVYEAGLREGDVADGLAGLCQPVAPASAKTYARQALAAKNVTPEVRASILIHLARCETEDHNYETAIGLLKELVLLRRQSEDWGLLGMCYLLQKRPKEALPALQKALSIRPDSYTIHIGLAETYRQLGDTQQAQEHQEKADWLRKHEPP
jgi:tetratricopeptide (TPR) repeat protein